MSTRSRSLIDPFNEKVRERIFGFGSRRCNSSITTGSEHDGDINDAVSSPSSSSSASTYSADSPRLSYLVNNFLETSGTGNEAGDSEDDDSVVSDPTDLICDVVNPIVWSNSDRFRADLLAHVTKAAEIFSLLRQNPTVFNRNVMSYLREIGYNSGICKTKWEAVPGGGLISGSYEYIDVLRERNSRYVVDLNFGAQFEVARETERYGCVIGALPRVFVGKCEDLKGIVRIMADELRRSMKMSEMSLPPWRKYRYMKVKWFGPYCRTVNQMHSSAAVSSNAAVKCRSVGFFASAVDGGRLVVAPPSTRTR